LRLGPPPLYGPAVMSRFQIVLLVVAGLLALGVLVFPQATHPEAGLAVRAWLWDIESPWSVNWNRWLVETTIIGAAAAGLWRWSASGFRLPG
jgi:hypothetical protein